MAVELTDEKKIAAIEFTVNSFLTLGMSPPKTSADLMKIFKGCGDKDEIIQWFRNGKIKWIKDMEDPTSNEEYQNLMNTAIIKYLTTT